MCFDSLNSSDIACGEYASRTLSSKQAPSMANTIAIDSKQGRRAKPEGSPSLLCAFHPRFWGDFPDERRFLCLSSGLLGRFPGQKVAFMSVISVKRILFQPITRLIWHYKTQELHNIW